MDHILESNEKLPTRNSVNCITTVYLSAMNPYVTNTKIPQRKNSRFMNADLSVYYIYNFVLSLNDVYLNLNFQIKYKFNKVMMHLFLIHVVFVFQNVFMHSLLPTDKVAERVYLLNLSHIQ